MEVSRQISAAMAAIVVLCLSSAASAAVETRFAAPGNTGGYFQGVFHSNAEAPPLETVLRNLPSSSDHDIVIQLTTAEPTATATTIYTSHAGNHRYAFRFQGKQNALLFVRGVRNGKQWVTQLTGPDLETTKNGNGSCGGPQLLASDEEAKDPISYLSSLPYSPPAADIGILAIGVQECRINCFAISDSAYITFEDLAFKDCWLPAIFATNSSYITLRRSFIQGSSYAFLARVSDPSYDPRRSHDFRIEDNLWI